MAFISLGWVFFLSFFYLFTSTAFRVHITAEIREVIRSFLYYL